MLLDVMLIIAGQVIDLPPVLAPRDARGEVILPSVDALVTVAVRPSRAGARWLASSPIRLREVRP